MNKPLIPILCLWATLMALGTLYPLIFRPQACTSLLGRTSRKYKAKQPHKMS